MNNDARQWAEDLHRYWEVKDVPAFVAYVLGRGVPLTELTTEERLRVQVAARAAYATIEQAQVARQQGRVDQLAGVEVVREGAAWLGL
ncbi:hypothetical protein [Deinococcus sp. S9]|uniref:hypothetical protein n=1 Tax=Deinococcus sp. S9 TaxID=2545754 RepID=UPI001055D392|nr:hypothetical protein [Deinococcus sp. S9]TDE87379.1 hypothetical protein E0686_02480 [Deinococcus sp. S9]